MTLNMFVSPAGLSARIQFLPTGSSVAFTIVLEFQYSSADPFKYILDMEFLHILEEVQ